MKATTSPRRRILLVPAAFVACGGCSSRLALPDVPISGGTSEQRAAAATELAEFDRWVGAGRLQIAGVEFRPLPDNLNGRYYRAWKAVDLDETLEPDQVRLSLRHELCHALDRSDELMDDLSLFQAFGDSLYDREQGHLDSHASRRGRRSEALAVLCESGPLGAAALSTPCPGDPDVADLFEYVASEVWAAYEPPTPSLGTAVVTAAYVGEPWTSFDIEPTASPERVDLTTVTGTLEVLVQLDLATGDRILGEWADIGSTVVDVPDALPPEGEVHSLVGWSTGPVAGVIDLAVRGQGDFMERMLWYDGDRWTTVPDECMALDRAQTEFFTADDRVWYAWGDGLTVSWAPLGD